MYYTLKIYCNWSDRYRNWEKLLSMVEVHDVISFVLVLGSSLLRLFKDLTVVSCYYKYYLKPVE